MCDADIFIFPVSTDAVFLATIGEEEFDISNAEVIMWNMPVINLGGHYDVVTGAFTAPIDGYYYFNVQKESNNNKATLYYVKEGIRLAFVQAYMEYDSIPLSTSSIILELQAGERVQIENVDSNIIYGTLDATIYKSWFMGFLLHSM